uniref:Uncharacterized protein n=1 Tax=Plectus sambesii TaxID=2011161 RepID=A0A914URM2_9BILA
MKTILMSLSYLLLLCSLQTTLGQQQSAFYILIDAINIFSCRGVTNRISLNEDDVFISNEKGNQVYYIKAPGNYTINFKKINVLENFGYLTGEIGATLQVPLFEGPAGIRFDLPYTMIPETGLLNQQCDENSGIVERNGRQYCRYCDMCKISEQIENGLNRGRHKYLPELARGSEDAFTPKCDSVSATSYEFKRTISLPDRTELERRVKDKFSGLDGEIKKRLNKGRGRFQVFLNLITSEEQPIRQSHWFSGSQQCRCCSSAGASDLSCRVLSFLYCNKEDCKSAWAQQCLHNSAKIAACFTVEFNYRLTDDYGEVLQFLRKNNYPNQEKNTAPAVAAAAPSVPDAPRVNLPTRKIDSQTASSVKTSDKALQEQCVALMPERLTHLRRYCTIFWNAKLCCTHCQELCPYRN